VADLHQQLAELRNRIARIDRKYELRNLDDSTPQIPAPAKPSRCCIEEWAPGEVVENAHGVHYQMEKLYPSYRRHGSADIGALAELPHNLLDALGASAIPACSPESWAFLDTETTGLAGGSGTYAFLIGVGSITAQGFRIRQFFMREYAEEKSLLLALSEYLAQFQVLITYNGKTYDQPLLETRYRMTRQLPPFSRLPHLDLLHGSRRLWKLRFENCKLSYLENQVLGFEREGDLPGELIPYVYFEYLRSGEAQRLVPIFHHNAIDILTLGCLTAIVPSAFRSSDITALESLGLRRGEEYLGIARWFLAADQVDQGLALMKRAVDTGLPDALLFRALWDIAKLEKKCGRDDAAYSLLAELASCLNPHRAGALVELAKHYEHGKRNYKLALEYSQRAAECAADGKTKEEISHRIARLESKIRRAKPRPLL
jgi:uncharacterized protein